MNGRGHTANEGEAELVEETRDQNSVLTRRAKRSRFEKGRSFTVPSTIKK